MPARIARVSVTEQSCSSSSTVAAQAFHPSARPQTGRVDDVADGERGQIHPADDAADQRVSRGQGQQLARLGQGCHAPDESQPGTADLDTLLERVRPPATLHTAGDLAALPTARRLAVHRITLSGFVPSAAATAVSTGASDGAGSRPAGRAAPIRPSAAQPSRRTTASATALALPGFCPVIRRSSSTTWVSNGFAAMLYRAPSSFRRSSRL